MKALGLRVYGVLSSLKLTIVVLSLLAVALIFGTFYESANGTPMAHRTFYASKWFDALLLLLATNMVACTAKRYPYKPHQLGFLMVHCGILSILTGAFLTRNYGREGELFLMEGETRDFMTTTRPYLRMNSPNDNVEGWEMPLVFPAKATGAEVDRTVSVPKSDLRVAFSAYYPNARWEHLVTEGDRFDPALLVHVEQQDRVEERWLQPSDVERAAWDGPLRIESTAAGTEAELRTQLDAIAAEQPRGRGILHLTIGNQPMPDVGLDGDLPRTVRAGDYEIHLRDWYPHFVFDGNKPSNASEAAVNPALWFDVRGPRGEENHVVFGLHEFRTLLSADVDRGYNVHARYELPAATHPPRVRFIRGPNGDWFLGSNVAVDVGADRKIAVGHTYRVAVGGMQLSVTKTLDQARAESRLVNQDREERNPAVRLQIHRGDVRSEPTWLVFGDSRPIRVGDHEVMVEMGRRQLPLGFGVQLVDFQETTYPGTTQSATYASDVLVADPGHPPVPIHISMNQPLKHRGFRLFQSSYVRDGDREASIFSVSYDPGVTVVYTGFIIFISGLIAIFYLKPLIRRAYARPISAPRPTAVGTVAVERTS